MSNGKRKPELGAKKKKTFERFPEGHKIFQGGKYIQEKSGMIKRNPAHWTSPLTPSVTNIPPSSAPVPPPPPLGTRPVSRTVSGPMGLRTEVRRERYKGGGKTKYRHSNGLEQHD